MLREGAEADNYINRIKGLKMIGYDKQLYFECGCKGERSVILPAAAQRLRDQWKLA